MTMQCAVKDSWSGRQVWWCPSTLTTKLMQWQNLVVKTRYWQEPWLPNHKVQWNMTLSNTDQVKDLHGRGDVGVHTQLDPMKLLFQSRPPLPRQHQSRINSMILCQVHTGHDDKDKECTPSNSPRYCTGHGSKVSCELTWILMRAWFVLYRYLNKFKF